MLIKRFLGVNFLSQSWGTYIRVLSKSAARNLHYFSTFLKTTSLLSRTFPSNRLQYTMSSASSTVVTGAKPVVIDKDKFSRELNLWAVKVDARLTKQYMTTFSKFLFKIPRLKSVYEVPNESDKRYILLAETVKDKELTDIPDDLRAFNTEHGGVVEPYQLTVGYDLLSVEEVLKQVLPSGVEVPSSFEQIGHIAHVNLRDEVLEYRYTIGAVILDKNSRLRTVVNKLGSIETEFRTFPMEVLAGDNDMDVSVKESGAKFTFNFAEVYWNSRLSTEHQRLVDVILGNKSKLRRAHQDCVRVADLMGGVGPFAVPLAIANTPCIVHANDLNPQSYKYLKMNSKTNSCKSDRLSCYNLDGREFVYELIANGITFDHAILNLPSTALNFLDCFVGLGHRITLSGANISGAQPRIHVYCFSTADDPGPDVIQRAATVLRCDVSDFGPAPYNLCDDAEVTDKTTVHIVRNVAPKKNMICLSFTLPIEVSMRPVDVRKSTTAEAEAEPAGKRRKTDA